MSSVERKTYMAKLRLNEMLADHDVSLPADLYDEIASALREQPEARGVVRHELCDCPNGRAEHSPSCAALTGERNG